jgi:hypothetical protein
MLRHMRLQSLFGFANNRHVWQQGSKLRASLSESLKVCWQQRNMVHARHRHALESRTSACLCSHLNLVGLVLRAVLLAHNGGH